MKLVLLTNMPSYHQIELGEALAQQFGVENFRLVFHKPTSDARQEMGWGDAYQAPFVIRYWESESAAAEVAQWIDSADVVIQGRFPIKLLRSRINDGKLTFAYQERFWKKRFSPARIVSRLPRLIEQYWSVNRANYHLLAAGAYVASDLNGLGVFRNRSWRFGYFIRPHVPPVKDPVKTLKLLWCARFSKVKQAHHALEIAKGLNHQQPDFRLTMIGGGEFQSEIMQQAAQAGLDDRIEFTGWQSEQTVAQLMQQSDVLLMTSDFGEGWALVVNEAMSHGCAVVANRAIGSAPWLIKDGESGLLYDNQSLPDLIDRLVSLSKQELNAMGECARMRHAELWSAPVAAQRIKALSQSLLSDPDNASKLYAEGPCSLIQPE